MTWLWCDTEPTEVFLVFENVITRDEIWNIFIDFLDTANDIACSRTDGKISREREREREGPINGSPRHYFYLVKKMPSIDPVSPA